MFEPWVGHEYGHNSNYIGGHKLLILGESHYTEKEEWIGRAEPQDTKEVVRYLAIENRYRFFTTLSKLVTGESREAWTDEANKKFWDSVAFYNFIPAYLPKGGRPETALWEAGTEPFRQVIDTIKPETVIVCGIGLWWWVMNSLPGGISANPPDRDTGSIGNGIGVRIAHPTGSRGKSRYTYEKYRPMVERAMNERDGKAESQ